jgi:hypothetical protein
MLAIRLVFEGFGLALRALKEALPASQIDAK